MTEPKTGGPGGVEIDPPPRIDSCALLKGGRRLVIVHNGQEYLLQVTRAKRLILTK